MNMIQMECIEGVQKFRMARNVFGKGVYFTTAYRIDGMLIDSGCAWTAEELLGAIRNHEIRRIVNTHTHEDHIGGNAAVQSRYRSSVFVHPAGLDVLHTPAKHLQLKPYQSLLWGFPRPSSAAPIGETVETAGYQFEVIHTPGHSPDHICLFETNKGWLFSGDAFIGGRDRTLRSDYDVHQIIRSLKKLLRLDLERLFPSSGHVRTKPRSQLIEKVEYLENSAEKVLELHRRGWTPDRIARRIFGRKPLIEYFTLGHFSRENLVRSFLEDGSH